MSIGVFAPQGGSLLAGFRGTLNPPPHPTPSLRLDTTCLPLRLGRAALGYGCLRDAWSSQHRCWCHASNRGSSAQGARINLSRCFANIPENQSKLNCPLSPGLHYMSGMAWLLACSHPGRWQECSGIAHEILDNLKSVSSGKAVSGCKLPDSYLSGVSRNSFISAIY